MEWLIIAIPLIIAAFFVGKIFASKPIEHENEKIRQECYDLVDQREKLLGEIIYQTKEIDWQKKELENINKQYQDKLQVIENAKQLAEDAANERRKNLEIEFQKQQLIFKQQEETLQQQINEESQQLESLKQTKAAAIEAARKEQMISDNKDEYRLTLPKEEKRDVDILLDAKEKISKPRVAAMAIWNGYYQQLAKTQFPRILGKQDACGIYKITNQKTGECYIGQALDIRKRWYEHCKNMLGIDTPVGSKLCAAVQDYGIENFTFEILQECKNFELNEKEKYFIELYNSNTFGYNKTAGNK